MVTLERKVCVCVRKRETHLLCFRWILICRVFFIVEEIGVQTLHRLEAERTVDGVEEVHVSCVYVCVNTIKLLQQTHTHTHTSTATYDY